MVTAESGGVAASAMRDETALTQGFAAAWTARDWVAGFGIFFATAAVILWQNAHIAVLGDLSYVLDTAERIAAGQMPYRDFPLAHAPGTFLIQAILIRLIGRVYWHPIAYAAVVGGLGSVLTWRLALETLRHRVRAAWTIALLLAAPLAVLGIYCILPNPFYDCDCAFWMLVALWALLRVEGGPAAHDTSNYGAGLGRPARGFRAGILACVPLFFKQNMGLLFLFAVVVAAVALLLLRSIRRDAPGALSLLALLAGVAATLSAAALVLHFTAGIANCVRWTIGFAAQRRLPGLREMLEVYTDPNLLWSLPCIAAGVLLLARARGALRWSRIAGFVLLAAPLLATLFSLLLYGDADERGDALLALWPLLLIAAAAVALWNVYRQRDALTLRELLPFVILAAINGTLMSQQLWGSTYAIWPLLVLLMAELMAALNRATPRAWPVPALAALAAVTLLVCGGLYTASEERLTYARFPAGPAMHSAYPQLAGLAAPGEYLPDFDELLRYCSANIPFGDGILLIPGEDPFYYATGRVPRFPVLFFDHTTDPYSPQQIAALVRSRGIQWLIVKRNLQLVADPTPDRTALLDALQQEFTPAAQLGGYDVYRR